MTEHSAVIFVFFFLAEYASIVLICILTSILFLGGYLNILPLNAILYIINTFTDTLGYSSFDFNNIFSNYLVNGLSSLNLALKTSFLIFVFI